MIRPKDFIMTTIWKYPLLDNICTIMMPLGAKVLHVEIQHEVPCLWALVNPEVITEPRHFQVISTGHPIEFPTDKFIGTFLTSNGKFVFHVFES